VGAYSAPPVLLASFREGGGENEKEGGKGMEGKRGRKIEGENGKGKDPTKFGNKSDAYDHHHQHHKHF